MLSVLRRCGRVALLAALAAACSVSVTEARRHSHTAVHKPHLLPEGHNSTDFAVNNPVDFSDPDTIALFARVEKQLAARNYSRPTAWDLLEHGYITRDMMADTVSNGVLGVDISAWAGTSTWSCLKSNGYTFAVVRGGQQSCNPDPNGVHSVANAWAAGISHVDIYIYPSWTCGTGAAQQVDNTINTMGSIPFGQLWFDVEEGGAAGAGTDHAWLAAGVNRAIQRLGKSRVGIYSSRYGWQVAMGSYADFGSFPIWYAHYDYNPSFSDWVNFAGWTRPSIKQYQGDANVCSFSVDLDYYN